MWKAQISLALLVAVLAVSSSAGVAVDDETGVVALARQLAKMQMTELLEALTAEQTGALPRQLAKLDMPELLGALLAGGDAWVECRALLAETKLVAARHADGEARRNELLDEAMAIQGELIGLTAGLKGYRPRLLNFRMRLSRAVAGGIEKAELPVARIRLLMGRPADHEAALAATGPALEQIDRLLAEMQATHAVWNRKRKGDPEAVLGGHVDRLEKLLREAAYRRAWIRLHRAMALPRSAPQRRELLKKAIEGVKPFMQDQAQPQWQ